VSDPATHAVSHDRETWQAVVLRPGDRVLVCTANALTTERAELIRDELGRRFPGVEFTIMDSVAALARMGVEVNHVE
jgi:hypothetical protein